MASRGGTSASSASGGGLAGTGTSGEAGGGGGDAAGGGAVLAGIGLALRTAQQMGNAMAGRMEQTAAHAGMHGAYPYSTVSGTPRYGVAHPPRRPAGGAGQQAGEGDGEPLTGPPPFPDEPGAPSAYAGDAGLNDDGDGGST